MPTPDYKKLKAILDRSVKADRFTDRKLYEDTGNLREGLRARKVSTELGKLLPPAQVEVVHRRLVRAAFFIELVKRDVTSTKYDVRWTNRLDNSDPRKASFDECCAIYEALCQQLLDLLRDPTFQEEIKLFVPWGLSPHEMPVDYESKAAVPIHSRQSVRIRRDPQYVRLLKIRQSLLDPNLNPDFQLFAAIFDKIRVKSYLTDRALTGDYKTNREKRWEAHPGSPQFALRRDCFAVELALIDQLVRFKSFPPGVIEYLKRTNLLGDVGKVARCPVTLDPLDFEILAQEVTDPTHGKAAYQVGHMNPLKAGAGDEFRHAPANISWITEDGNRIQGHLTLKETRDLLFRISKNYEALARGEFD
jgi:hypothetical protein